MRSAPKSAMYTPVVNATAALVMIELTKEKIHVNRLPQRLQIAKMESASVASSVQKAMA